MRSIAKGPEPASLTTHEICRTVTTTTTRTRIRYGRHLWRTSADSAVIACAASRTSRETMKIEHWRSRSTFPDEELDYRNLLAACRGGEGQPLRQQPM